MVIPQGQDPDGANGVAAPQLAALPHLTVDPQLGPASVGRPGDAVVGPVVGAIVVRQVYELVADPEAHLPGVPLLRDGDHQLVVAAVRRVGDQGVDVSRLQQDVHADGERVQANRVFEVG